MKTHPHHRSLRRTTALILAGSIAALLASHSAQAASQNWTGGSVLNGNWSTIGNWSGGAAPGSTSLTTSTDIATFNAAIANTWGNTALNPIVIDSATQNIRGITFTGAAGNYFIGSTGGNALKLTSGGTIQIANTLTATNSIETINAPLALQGTSYTFTNNSANGSGAGAGTLNFGGGITGTTGAPQLNLNGSNTNANTISGIIGNGTATSMAVNKSGTGTWVLTGANTFTGILFVSGGTLSINSIANVGVASAAGAGSSISLGITPKLQFTGASGGSSNRQIAITGNGPTTIENTVAGQTLTLSGNVTVTSGNYNASLELTGAGDGVLSGVVSNTLGRVSLSKSGAGTWTVSGANTYIGDTTVSGGTLKLGNSKALGFGGVQRDSTAVTTVNSGFTLDLNGTTAVNEPITLNGTGIGGNGTLVNYSGTPASIANGIAGAQVASVLGTGSGYTTAPTVTLSGTGTGATATASLGVTAASFSIAGGTTVYSSAPSVSISGGFGGASATAILSGGATGTVTGITVTNAGTGFSGTPTILFSGGTVTTAGTNPTGTGVAGQFTVSGITMTAAGSGYTGTPTYTFGSGNATPGTVTLSSVNLATVSSIGGSGNMSISSVVSGAGLTKVGAGTLTLSGANTYSGDTTIKAGTLKLDAAGNLINTANLIVGDAGSSGAILDVTTKTGGLTIGLAQTISGIGQVNGNTIILGTHAPGNSPGLQTFNGNLAYSTGSMVNWELATNSVGTRGTDFDGIDVIGAGILSIASGVTSNLIFNAPGSAVNFANPFWDSSHSWSVFSNVNAPMLASGAIFDTIIPSLDSLGATLSGGSFSWAQVGNNVNLNYTVSAVPEPATYGALMALGLVGVGTLSVLRRRRRAGA